MTLDQALAFALMGGAVILFIWGRLRYDLVAVLALVTGVAIGVIPEERMFSGFSNDLIWIIAAVLVTVVNLIVDLLYGWLDPRIRVL